MEGCILASISAMLIRMAAEEGRGEREEEGGEREGVRGG